VAGVDLVAGPAPGESEPDQAAAASAILPSPRNSMFSVSPPIVTVSPTTVLLPARLISNARQRHLLVDNRFINDIDLLLMPIIEGQL